MPVDIANTEAKLEFNFPSRVKIRNGRLFCGVNLASDVTTAPAVTKVLSVPGRSWFGTVTELKDGDLLTGLDIDGVFLHDSKGFNTFGVEHQIVGEDEKVRFLTALTLREGSEVVIPRDPSDLTLEELKFICSFVGFGAVQQAGALISLNNVRVPWNHFAYTQS